MSQHSPDIPCLPGFRRVGSLADVHALQAKRIAAEQFSQKTTVMLNPYPLTLPAMPGPYTCIPTQPQARPPQKLFDRRNNAQCAEFMAQVRAHLKAAERNAEIEKARKEGLPYTRGRFAVYCPPHARKRTEEDKKREERKEARRVRRESRKTRRGQRAEQHNARKEREEAKRANEEKRAKEETAKEKAKKERKDAKRAKKCEEGRGSEGDSSMSTAAWITCVSHGQ